MIIVVACDVPLKDNNGTAIAAANLIASLREKGHEVRVLCPDRVLAGMENYYVTAPINLGPLNRYVEKNGVVLSKKDKKTLLRALDGVDALHVMTPFFLCCAAAREARKRGIPVTAGFHCQAENFTNHIFMMNVLPVNKLIYQIFYYSLFRRVDCIHYPSQFIRSVFESETKRSLPCRVISNGVGREFVRRRREKPEEFKNKYVILYTGRYSREKSHRVLIKAVARSKYTDKIQLIFAGDGPLREKLEKYSKKKLKNQPVFGFHPRAELVEIINYSDLYVHPAEIEIEAIACLEAIKCGLVPVISNSRRSATRHFALDERNLFNCNDPADLARKIDYWLDHPEERERCSQRYLGYTKRFDRDTCMNEMEKMIINIVQKRHEA
ncbi:MAG TPA: glycosyltransferase family 4 protein [Clostridiales bacterium]|jgi:1,2-diacylglycerol 3-alpha-glucosyltransferase|nr:glycosyltransferase family 4 protein [Clostridiales bacterium]